MTKLTALTSLGVCLALGLGAVSSGAADYSPTGTANLAISSKGYSRMTFDPTGTRLAVSLRKGADNKFKIVFLNVPDLGVIRELNTETEPLSLAYSRQGDLFALTLAEGGGQNLAVVSTTDWKPVHSDRDIPPNPSAIAFDPVGDFLMVGHSNPPGISRFVVGPWTNEKIPSLEVDVPCVSLAISLDGRYSAAGGANAKLAVWLNDDSAKAQTRGSLEFKGPVNAVAFSPDSKLLAGGDSAGNVVVWYLAPDGVWALQAAFTLPSGGVTGVGFLNDLSLATASSDGVVARWDLANTAQPVEAVNVATQDSQAFAIDPRGKWMVVGGDKISIFPLGSPVPEPVTEMPSAPFTIVETSPPDKAPPVPQVTSIEASPSAVIPEPATEDHGNFLFWLALGNNGGDGQDWIQGWAGQIDEGRFSPLQLVLPFESLNSGVMLSNLGNIGKVLKPRDFSVFYASAVIVPAKEKDKEKNKGKEKGKDKDKEEFTLAFGPGLEQRTSINDLLHGFQTAAGIAPSVWFLDLKPSPTLTDEQTTTLFGKIAAKIENNDDGTPRSPLGVGLLVISKDGAYPEMAASISDGLAGQADTDQDGKVMDMEMVKYLAEHCRTAIHLKMFGAAKDPIPVLPAFNLKRN